jgi:hypothetical protein
MAAVGSLDQRIMYPKRNDSVRRPLVEIDTSRPPNLRPGGSYRGKTSHASMGWARDLMTRHVISLDLLLCCTRQQGMEVSRWDEAVENVAHRCADAQTIVRGLSAHGK